MPALLPDRDIARSLRPSVHPLSGGSRDYDGLIERIGDARFVLIGEASHGTHEFYSERVRITRRLVEEKGFSVVAVEADWPDAYRVNRYVRGSGEDADGVSALGDFQRFPMWMWRNADVLEFVEWLSEHNARLSSGQARTGFYGLDLYSLHASVQAVVGYLDKVDPEAARQARERYSCFDFVGKDPQAYGLAASLDVDQSCEQEVVAQLVELQRRAAEYARRDGRIAEDEYFYAEQNARLAQNAEAYYRSMFQGRVSSWNLRDRHMVETLSALVEHLEAATGRRVKAVVWAHNSHLGDARATEMGRQGEWNVGQLVRQRYGDEAVNVGFSTYDGTVTAASRWDAPAEFKRVRPGLPGSYEALFHEVGSERFLVPLRGGGDAAHGLRPPRLQRAIGVIYRPQTERQSHYFEACLPDQFDYLIHMDRTEAVEPLDRGTGWDPGEVPDTYPAGV